MSFPDGHPLKEKNPARITATLEIEHIAKDVDAARDAWDALSDVRRAAGSPPAKAYLVVRSEGQGELMLEVTVPYMQMGW